MDEFDGIIPHIVSITRYVILSAPLNSRATLQAI